MKSPTSPPNKLRTGLKYISLLAVSLFCFSALASAATIQAGFKEDFQIPSVGGAEQRSFRQSNGSTINLWSWEDGSGTGLWSVSMGNRYTPWLGGSSLAWSETTPSYRYSGGYIADDANHTILPHSNPSSYSTVITWTALEDSMISISGSLKKATASDSNGGVVYSLYKYDAQTGTGISLWSQTVTAATTTVIPTNATTDISMNEGDRIYFVISTRLSGDSDASRLVYFSQDFQITGHAIPEGSSLAMLGLGTGLLMIVRGRKRSIAKCGVILGLFAMTAMGAIARDVNAGYLEDYKIVDEGVATWKDGSDTGTWTLGFGNRLKPSVNFLAARLDPKIGGRHGAYGMSYRLFVNDPERTIIPGASAYSGSAVIRWTATERVRVAVSGKIAKVHEASGNEDGVDLFLYHEDKRLWIKKDVIDVTPQEVKVKDILVNAGESLYFVVSPKENNANDTVCFSEDLRIVGATEN